MGCPHGRAICYKILEFYTDKARLTWSLKTIIFFVLNCQFRLCPPSRCYYCHSYGVVSHKASHTLRPFLSIVRFLPLVPRGFRCLARFTTILTECVSIPESLPYASYYFKHLRVVSFRSLFYDAFSVTRLYGFDDRVTSKWRWIGEDKHPCLSGIRTHGISVQAIKAYAPDRAATGTGCFHGVSMVLRIITNDCPIQY
jgi:hypothetical protein